MVEFNIFRKPLLIPLTHAIFVTKVTAEAWDLINNLVKMDQLASVFRHQVLDTQVLQA